MIFGLTFFFSSRRRHTRWTGDWSSDVCSSDLGLLQVRNTPARIFSLGLRRVKLLLQPRQPAPKFILHFLETLVRGINRLGALRLGSGKRVPELGNAGVCGIQSIRELLNGGVALRHRSLNVFFGSRLPLDRRADAKLSLAKSFLAFAHRLERGVSLPPCFGKLIGLVENEDASSHQRDSQARYDGDLHPSHTQQFTPLWVENADARRSGHPGRRTKLSNRLAILDDFCPEETE